ncbi:transketolase [Shinella sp.]|uniref:transketolase n=1 Tax=Shinella sp. TaxID=1870904 RepID=UPI0039E4F109
MIGMDAVPVARGTACDIDTLEAIARELRRQVVRLVASTGQGYVQQGLGAADLFAALYFVEMRLDPENPDWDERDRFVLSTAHNTAIFYATLAARGLIHPAMLTDYCRDGSPLEINASERLGTVVEATCGSLGQGLSVAAGMAAAARRRGSDRRIYVMLGDGEMQEGQVWEAAMAVAGWRLSNLCLIIDDNRMQADGDIETVMPMGYAADKWKAFGWRVEEIDGNDMRAILDALDTARQESGKPTCILARTLVGKGAPSLEGIFGHNMKLPADVAARALAELERSR